MNKLFIFQLIISFIVGGGVVAILSFVAEKVSKRIAGIILVFPTTVALGFFFLGWTISPEAVAKVIPATLIPLGLSALFSAVYSYVAEYSEKIINHKIWQIVTSFVISIGVWFVLAIPIVLFKFNHLLIGILGYAIFILIAHLLLRRKNYHKAIILNYTTKQKIGRAIFIGFSVFIVVLLGKTLNPFWGGIFTVFPAVLSSLLIILHWYYNSKNLFPTVQKVPIGSLSSFMYAITVMLAFPKFGFILGTLFAYIVSLTISLLLMKFQPKRSNQ